MPVLDEYKPSVWDMRIIRGFSSTGKLLYEQIYSVGEFYDDFHPIIDKDDFRRFHKIAKIEVRCEPHTPESVEWEMNYDESGALIETWRTTGGIREPFVPLLPE